MRSASTGSDGKATIAWETGDEAGDVVQVSAFKLSIDTQRQLPSHW